MPLLEVPESKVSHHLAGLGLRLAEVFVFDSKSENGDRAVEG